MKKKHPEHVNLERWLVSYADFITLLFAFFVVMYAISQADLAKFKAVSQSIKQAFGSVDLGGGAGGESINILDTESPVGGRVMEMPTGKTHTASEPDPEVETLYEKLEETLSVDIGVSQTSDQIKLEYDSKGLVVRLAVKGYYDQGSIKLPSDLLPLMDRIGAVLAKTDRLFRVEGHTDSTELKLSDYKNNWELSTARAAWITDYWIKRFEIDPKRVGVTGYGAHRPLAKGTDRWALGANRRIEIIILNNSYVQPKNREGK